jgi:carboxypeptidase family protein/TonB-dependent receptor-like protein
MRLLSRAVLRQTAGRSLIFVLLLSSVVAAQQPVGAVSGIVRDSGGAPVVSVEVSAGKVPVFTRTDSTGAYRLGGLALGKTQVQFRRLGFEPQTKDVVVSSQAQTVNVTMEELPVEMAALITEATARVREALRDFWNRREQGYGHFITRADIEDRHPTNLSDMLRLIPGMQLIPQRAGGEATLRFARNTGGHDCPPQYFIDGVMARGYNIDDMPPEDVEGIEIYPGVSTVPPQFKSIVGTSACGVVAIWSRVPGT